MGLDVSLEVLAAGLPRDSIRHRDYFSQVTV